MNKSVTIKDIATESGVSIATVSRVLNGNVPVSGKTRKKVEEVIQKYDFSPNALARGLIRHQTMTIGVIMPDIENPFFSAMFREIEQAAHDADYSVFLCNTMYRSSSSPDMENEYFKMMIDKQVDGVLVAGGQIDLCRVNEVYHTGLAQMAQQVPVGVIGKSLPDIPCQFFEQDSSASISTAIQYLISLGHRHIAFIGGEPGIHTTEDRLDAYRKTLTDNDIPIEEDLIALSDYYVKDGFRAIQQLMNKGVHFTAALAMNDNVAIGAIRALADWHKRVPEDIALISCDQFSLADYLSPRLTSINRHNEQFGRLVIDCLLCAIRKQPIPQFHPITPELIIRESSGSPIL